MRLAVLLAAVVACTRPAPQQPISNTPPSGLEARIAMLEARLASYTEALEFLKQVYDQNKAQAAQREADEPAPDAVFAVDIDQNVKLGMVDGPNTAGVTIVKAFDFACPFCEQTSPILHDLVKDNGGKVRVVFKNFVVHPDQAMVGHLASCGAAKQRKYLPFKEAFWSDAFIPYRDSRGSNHAAMELDNVLKIATKVGLDTKKLKTDMDGSDCKAVVQHDMDELGKFKVNATPTFFINGKLVDGALPKAAFQTLIDEQLKVVDKSGVKPADYYQLVVMAKGEKTFRSKKDAKP